MKVKYFSIFFILSSFIAFQAIAKNNVSVEKNAILSGDHSLNQIGRIAEIHFQKKLCLIKTVGEQKEKESAPDSFRIEFICQNKVQILWDMAKPNPDDSSFDEPKFSLLWAGDRDKDGKIDIEMEMSPKYSCSKKVLYLSSKAKKGQLVGISGNPKKVCGA